MCVVLFALVEATLIPIPGDRVVRCDACEITIDFLEHVLNKVDAKKTIQVGSLHTKGDRRRVKLKMSETRVTEILESLCEDLPERHALARHSKTFDWHFLFDEDADDGLDKDIYKKHMMFKYVVNKIINRICHRLLSDHEEDIVDFLFDNYAKDLDMRNKICHKISRYCPTRKIDDGKPKKIFALEQKKVTDVSESGIDLSQVAADREKRLKYQKGRKKNGQIDIEKIKEQAAANMNANMKNGKPGEHMKIEL